METITLDTARKIMRIIGTYNGPMQADALVAAIADLTGDSLQTITKVIEFLQEVKAPSDRLNLPVVSAQAPASRPPAEELPPIDDTPLNLMDELTYNYKVAKRVLQTSLVGDRTVDAEETRKSLRTISAFMEQALKLQERLYNAQQIQKFQDAVLDVIGTVDPVYRDNILLRLNDL